MLRGVGFGWSGVEDEGGYEWRAEVPAFQRGVAWRERERRGGGGGGRRGRGAKERKKRAIERESGGQSAVFSPSSELVEGQGKAGWSDDYHDDDYDHGCFSSLSLSLSPSLCPSLRDRSTTDTRFDVTRWLATGTWRTVAVERAACPVHLFFQAET